MSDLISREALLEEIKENQWGWFSREMMLLMLENQPAVTDTNVWNKWIPCSEKLPDEEEIVQVTYIGHTDGLPYCDGCAYLKYGGWFWSLYDGEVKVEIVAWKPNCEPYKG